MRCINDNVCRIGALMRAFAINFSRVPWLFQHLKSGEWRKEELDFVRIWRVRHQIDVLAAVNRIKLDRPQDFGRRGSLVPEKSLGSGLLKRSCRVLV